MGQSNVKLDASAIERQQLAQVRKCLNFALPSFGSVLYNIYVPFEVFHTIIIYTLTWSSN